MTLLPGVVLLVLAAWFLGAELVLRRRSRWAQGALNHFHWQVALPPLILYVVAAVLFSVGSWSILSLTSFLIALVLPAVISMAWLGLDPRRPVLHGAGLAAGLSVLGVVAVWLGR